MHHLGRRSSDAIPEIRIGYIGGGSQGWAHTLINDLAQCTEIAGTVALYDVDYEAARKNAELGTQVTDRADADGDWTFDAVRDLSAALSGADIVICSIQDPPAETFVHDIDLPKQYGIHQPVADTVGPGGILRSMRAIPQYREIAATVREQCPDAWVLNYTNPMTVCTRTLYEEFPEIKAIGLCHEVFQTQELFADLATTHLDGVDAVDSDEIHVTVKGINHFAWIDEARWRGRDLYRFLDAELAARKPLADFDPGSMTDASYWVNNYRVAFDLYDRFGCFPAAGDRHLVEFVPWYLELDDPEALHRWGIRLTPSEARLPADGPTPTERYLSGAETFEFTESGEEAVDIIRALLGLEPLETHLNYPNRGQVANLPNGAVVETNALLTGDAVTPLTAGSLPRPIRSLVLTHVHNQETLVEAGFDGDLDRAFRVFLSDPFVTLDRGAAESLFAELVERERPYLDAWDGENATILETGPDRRL
ncbi:family 4 glycosyl hydrolase [Natrialba aegyptia]|uniref:Glycoside hydrolase family 4 n=1 Tax=Natrialba aegyptia DSM 13077 TaxID=1227491 RepID=M0AII3_9EURY|nr:glycoside hydrolase family 4 [Natrialba aegyptia]ELY97712.1 glycoside hydrolase family 4 [Natrialba aegyptia DSM 13077]